MFLQVTAVFTVARDVYAMRLRNSEELCWLVVILLLYGIGFRQRQHHWKCTYFLEEIKNNKKLILIQPLKIKGLELTPSQLMHSFVVKT